MIGNIYEELFHRFTIVTCPSESNYEGSRDALEELRESLQDRAEELAAGIESVADALAYGLGGSDKVPKENAARVMVFLANLSQLSFACIRVGSHIEYDLRKYGQDQAEDQQGKS